MHDHEQEIHVFAGWLDEEPLIGTLYAGILKGHELYSFAFSDTWLLDYSHIMLDPDLYNVRGRQFVPRGKKIFGMFSDCAPDRWGRTLLKRKETILAREEQRAPKDLHEIDFILGIDDETRMGGLRFKFPQKDTYIASDKTLKVPPVEQLRTLESATLAFENAQNPYEKKWLEMLLQPGSSLGGARPKATAQDTDGTLWIAKFPSKYDKCNVGAWEKTTNDLARLCGLHIPRTNIKIFEKKSATFLAERFDRMQTTNGYKRLHYASAMTMLGKTDGASSTDGTSYLDIADCIRAMSIQPKDDLRELWKRITFSIMVSNTDDHLRNHGFLLDKKGWKLSPAFDINPNPDGTALSLLISRDDNTKDIRLASQTAAYYDISTQEAQTIITIFSEIIQKNWHRLAKTNGIDKASIAQMAPAFYTEKP